MKDVLLKKSLLSYSPLARFRDRKVSLSFVSYLNPCRLHFAGTFKAAISTVSNDPVQPAGERDGFTHAGMTLAEPLPGDARTWVAGENRWRDR